MMNWQLKIFLSVMSYLPASFDPILLQDELAAALEASPLTTQLVPLRAQQLIQIVLEKTIVHELRAKIQNLTEKLAHDQKKDKVFRNTHKKETAEQNRETQEKEKQLIDLQNKLGEMQAHSEELQECMAETEKALAQTQQQLKESTALNQQLEQQLMDKNKEIDSLVQEKNILQRQQKQMNIQWQQEREGLKKTLSQLQRTISEAAIQKVKKAYENQEGLKIEIQKQMEMQKDFTLKLQEKDKQMQTFKEERLNFKNTIKSLQLDKEELQQSIDEATKLAQQWQSETTRVRQELASTRSSFDRDRKMLNGKLSELSKTHRAHLKLRSHCKKIEKQLAQAREQHIRASGWINEQIRKVSSEVQNITRTILDRVAEQVGQQVAALSEQLTNQSENARVARSEAKMKEEAIERVAKQAEISNKEAEQLKHELRVRKREEERMRKELRRAYEDSETKFAILEKKYCEVLNQIPY